MAHPVLSLVRRPTDRATVASRIGLRFWLLTLPGRARAALAAAVFSCALIGVMVIATTLCAGGSCREIADPGRTRAVLDLQQLPFPDSDDVESRPASPGAPVPSPPAPTR